MHGGLHANLCEFYITTNFPKQMHITFIQKTKFCPFIQLVFRTKVKIRHFGVLSALVKDSRQFKQREKRLLKVVTVNLPLYKQLQY